MTFGQLLSVFVPDFCYGQGSGGGLCGCLSVGWYMLSSIGSWVRGRLTVGGFTAPSVTGTWCRLAVADKSAGGAVEKRISPIGIGYVTG